MKVYIEKINFFLFCIIVLIAIAVVNLSFNEKSMMVNTSDLSNNMVSQNTKNYSKATLADNFIDDSVIVVLDSAISQYRGISECFTNKICGDIDIIDIVDLTALPDNYIKKDGNIDADIAPKLADHLSKIAYKQILRITLSQANKQNVLDVVHIIEKMDGVLSANPDYYDSADVASPDDVLLSEQWAIVGENGIKANSAWEITSGVNAIRIGVIDSGIANHNDLNANRVVGWDWFNDSIITNDDIGGHGTSAAGIIGAVGNNSIGVSGVAQNISLVPYQTASNTSGSGSHPTWSRVDAILNARDLFDTNNRISILNHSIAGFGTNTDILAAAEQFPGLFVWSAGNNGDNLDDFISIDQFNVDNLVSVGAHDDNNERAIWNATQSSNFGNAVNIYAPGSDCLTTHSINATAYRNFSGTSAAAPYVSGVAALMLSVNPNMTGIIGETLGARLKNTLVGSADTITITVPTLGKQVVKKLNAYEAVKMAAFQTGNSGHTIAVRSGATLRGSVTIPSQVASVNITAIAANGFANQIMCNEIAIPSSVTMIEESAFANNPNLTINLLGRTGIPSNWSNHWNSSNRPVKFNGILCTHEHDSYLVTQTYHIHKCDDCWVKITANHSYAQVGDYKICECGFKLCVGSHDTTYHSNNDNATHRKMCDLCDYSVVQNCLTMAGQPGDTRYCIRCGQKIILGEHTLMKHILDEEMNDEIIDILSDPYKNKQDLCILPDIKRTLVYP